MARLGMEQCAVLYDMWGTVHSMVVVPRGKLDIPCPASRRLGSNMNRLLKSQKEFSTLLTSLYVAVRPVAPRGCTNVTKESLLGLSYKTGLGSWYIPDAGEFDQEEFIQVLKWISSVSDYEANIKFFDLIRHCKSRNCTLVDLISLTEQLESHLSECPRVELHGIGCERSSR